jgi:hypothetical protein
VQVKLLPLVYYFYQYACSFNTRSLQGFEVDPFPGVIAFGLIQPWDIINVPDNARRCILYSHNAIDTYNTKVGVSFFSFKREVFYSIYGNNNHNNYLLILNFVCSTELN